MGSKYTFLGYAARRESYLCYSYTSINVIVFMMRDGTQYVDFLCSGK
jgi:hypothetical protein